LRARDGDAVRAHLWSTISGLVSLVVQDEERAIRALERASIHRLSGLRPCLGLARALYEREHVAAVVRCLEWCRGADAADIERVVFLLDEIAAGRHPELAWRPT
jgi:hypothetical protein